MVEGLGTFKEYFKDYQQNYILIGGAACDTHMEVNELNFRATRDLDIVLVIEALTREFVRKFWQFILEGKYQLQEKSTGKKIFYRFTKPAVENFPFQLELFSRNPDIMLIEDSHLTPIPVDEDVSSLSAILLNEEYYNYTLKTSEIIDDLHVASVTTLICLKASAYLDLKSRCENGEDIDEKKIKKHKLDIIRLAATLTNDAIDDIPGSLLADMALVIKDIENDMPDGRALGKGLGIGILDINEIIIQLKDTFRL